MSFAAELYRNEIGVTSPLEPDDNTLLGDPVDDGVPDPEDTGGKFGHDVELFAGFMRALSAPPRLLPAAQKDRKDIDGRIQIVQIHWLHSLPFAGARHGERRRVGRCQTFRVPKALGHRTFHPYGDFLLHDIGTGPSVPA